MKAIEIGVLVPEYATILTDNLKISPVVIDKVLNHASGAVKGS